MLMPLHSPNDTVETLIQSGLRHAVALLDELLNQNGDYQNSRVDVDTFLSWLMEDHPDWSAELAKSGSTELFGHRLGRFLLLAQRRDELSGYLAQAECKPKDRDVDALGKRRNVRAAIQRALPRWSEETVEDAINDAAILLTSSRSFNAVGGCAVKHAPQVQRYMVPELSPMLQTVRQLAPTAQRDTCFLVARNDAPQSLQEYMHEQVAVVVPLEAKSDASWIFHCQDGRPIYRELVVEYDDGTIAIPLMVGLERGRILFDYEALRERVFARLRAQLPIMYVSSVATVLATHPFQPFAFAANFYAEVTNFQMGWESDVNHGMSFEQRVDSLRRDRLPRHVYVNRLLEDLTHSPFSSRAALTHPHSQVKEP
ncbi:hypothetical protein [Paraburkholderia sp. 32]|uniref:hypothetical protein n=1 Tax=Paraburkholderia sp. 32 TaxID=2991057 RepID=UPI003D1B21B4